MHGFSFHLIWRMARKELREILRDRRTIVTLLLMPVLLYPLLGVAFHYFLVTVAPATPETEYRIAVSTEAEARVLTQMLQLTEKDPKIRYGVFPDPVQAVRDNEVHLAMEIKGAERPFDVRNTQQQYECVIQRRNDSPPGAKVEELVRDRLIATNLRWLQDRLRARAGGAPVVPIEAEFKLIAIGVDRNISYLSSMIPLVLVLMTITGAVYPSIDLTAGERERGTLEILMAAPIPRVGLLLAKYVAVLAVTLLTGIVNLTMMTVTLMTSGLRTTLFPDGLGLGTILAVLALLLLFAAFFSAVLLSVASFARSFKEAQAYLIPLMLLAISPGIVSLLPDVTLGGPLTIAPLLNVVLLAKEIFDGSATFGNAVIVVVSTLLYAFSALAVAARIFGAEAVLYSEQGQWSDLFRRPKQPREAATVANALFCLALVFPFSVLLGGALGQLAVSETARLLAGSAASAALFVGVPLLAAWRGNVNLLTGFRLRPAALLFFAAAIVLGLSFWPLIAEILVLEKQARIWTMPEWLEQKLGELAAQRREIAPVFVLFGLAIMPAIVEELFFRGWLFTALERALRPLSVILLTALLFSLFHLFTGGVPLIERLLPTALLGLVLGWLRWKSGSVFPGMLMHVAHNGLLVSLAILPGTFGALSAAVEGEGHVPLVWLLGTAAAVGFGCVLIWLGRSRHSTPFESV
jgi:sodium transport system permease protein